MPDIPTPFSTSRLDHEVLAYCPEHDQVLLGGLGSFGTGVMWMGRSSDRIIGDDVPRECPGQHQIK